MNNYQFCQIINDENDYVDPEALITPTKTTTRTIEIPAIGTREETETMPVRRRSSTSTPTLTDTLSTQSPRQKISTAPKSVTAFPPPPPMFASAMSSTNPIESDFMFCVFCGEDSDGKATAPVTSAIHKIEPDQDTDSESNSMDEYSEHKKAFLQTTFNLSKLQKSQGITDYDNDILVLRSLLRAIPGVREISIPTDEAPRLPSARSLKNVSVHHDASVLTGTLRHAFESAGYSASTTTPAVGAIAKDKSKPPGTESDQKIHWVQSSFDVQGICCASEIPAIRRIVKPLSGVAKVNINLMTKVVLVQHNCVQIEAVQIAESLTNEGFPAQIRKDGATMIHFFENAPNGSGNDSEELRIKSLADALDRIGKSPFVESTLLVEGLRSDQVHWIEKALTNAFIRQQVRAVYPSAISETIKVEHNPDLVSILDIRDFLRRDGTHKNGSFHFPSTAEVYIDGADTNLYLPSEDDYPGLPIIRRDDGGFFALMKRYHVNVVLSGIFWIFSMLSILNAMDEFKYFGLASVLFGLPPIIGKAFRTLRRWQFDANCMMVTAAFGALALGEYDEAASVAFLFAVSEFLESRASTKARKALSEICALRPDHANVIHPITKEIVVVPADRVPPGSLISVRTGDKIATDGIVVEGSTSIDESSLTGESTPVQKNIGDEVSGGTINTGQTQLVVKTTTTAEDSAVSRLIRLVEEAQSNRSPTEMMVDSFARSYTPSVIFIATIMCTLPWYFGTEIGRQWTLNGLIIIVIACPCALTISTPVTYAAGLAATAKQGVIIKGGAKLEAMGSVDRIVFDKTGTLTRGKFSVAHLNVVGSSKTRKEMLELLSLLQERASHPIASSLVQAAKNEGVTIPRQMVVTDHQILNGEGIMAKVNDQAHIFVGNRRLFDRLGMFEMLSSSNKKLVEEWKANGGTIGFIGSRNDGIFGMFCVKDSVRQEARDALKELREAGIESYMCTGDSETMAYSVAKEVGIFDHCVNSELLPEDKLNFVEGLRRPSPKRLALCRQKRYVLFCGDGVNDAPALAAADIGVSMGEGAAMALEMSDVTLMDSRLTKLPYVIKMGQRVLRTVKENIAISFVAKFAVVVLALMGKMTLLYAIASDVGVMLLVTLNGMKLLPNNRFHINRKRKRRARSIFKQKNGPGKNTNFELVDLESEIAEPTGGLEIV